MLQEIHMEDYQILFARRRGILDKTYLGMKPEKEVWDELARDMRNAGYDCMADNLMQRYEEME